MFPFPHLAALGLLYSCSLLLSQRSILNFALAYLPLLFLSVLLLSTLPFAAYFSAFECGILAAYILRFWWNWEGSQAGWQAGR